jgi:hypothetical protein
VRPAIFICNFCEDRHAANEWTPAQQERYLNSETRPKQARLASDAFALEDTKAFVDIVRVARLSSTSIRR